MSQGWAIGDKDQDQVVYPSYLRYQWAAWFNNLDPGDDSGSGGPTWGDVSDSMTDVDTLMQQASADQGGSPYANATAYDPTDVLAAIDARIAEYDTQVDDFDPSTLMDEALDFAYAYADAHIVDTTNIDTVVAAAEARSRTDFLQRVSRVAVGLWEVGAAFNTQFYQTLGNMEMERANQTADLDAKLRLSVFNDRARIVMNIAEAYLNAHARKLESYRAAAAMTMDAGKLTIIAKGDETGENLKYEVEDALWDLNLLQYGVQVMGALSGAPYFPRNQTGRERLLASLNTSFSAGAQVAASTGNIPLGVGFGVAQLAGQMWGLGG